MDAIKAGEFAVRSTDQVLPLAMQHLQLSGELTLAGAHLRLDHQFAYAGAGPAEAVYAFGLPSDAALYRFAIRGEGFTAHSELRPAADALSRYDAAVDEGHLTALARSFRDGLVNLALGNLQPGERVALALEMLAGAAWRNRGLQFRFPFCLPPAYHARAAVGCGPGGGEMQLPDAEFGDLVLPPWRTRAEGVHTVGFALYVRLPQTIAAIASPSHRIRVEQVGDREATVSLAVESDIPDRDLVLEIETAEPLHSLVLGTGKPGRSTFMAAVAGSALSPPAPPETRNSAPRRVALVLDRSGSMSEEPMAQARAAAVAALGALSPNDEFALVAFDDAVEAFRPEMVRVEAGDAGRSILQQARQFLNGIVSRGGTELALGLQAAFGILDGRGDILLVTDGQVFGSEAIVPTGTGRGVRVHCLGIGAASRDRFLTQLARHSGGASRWLGPGERIDRAALELFSAMGQNAAVEISASIEPPDAGRVLIPPAAGSRAEEPLVLWGECTESHDGRLLLNWTTTGDRQPHSLTLPLAPAPADQDSSLRLLLGAHLITDCESNWGAGSNDELLRLSQEYDLASRVMSLVAVVERSGDVAGELPQTLVAPALMPPGVSSGSYFGFASIVGTPLSRRPPVMHRLALPDFDDALAYERCEPQVQDSLVELAGSLDPDGGVAGPDVESRVRASLFALLRFWAAGSTLATGPFRPHMAKLVDFVLAHQQELADPAQRGTCRKLLAWVHEPGAHAPSMAATASTWRELEVVLATARAVDRAS